MADQRTAVLLAAGRGTRLKGMTTRLPKCMVPVRNRTILDRALESLTVAGIERLVVVTGHEHRILQNYLKELTSSVRLEFVHSHNYATTNNIVSLLCARDCIDGDFLLFESDLLFKPHVLTELRNGSVALLSPLADWMDGTVTTLDDDGNIDRMYLKTDHRPDRPLYKTVNIYAIAADDWRNTLLPDLEMAVNSGDTNSYYERVIAHAIADGRLTMRGSVVDDQSWREVDTPEDLQFAEAWLEANHTKTSSP